MNSWKTSSYSYSSSSESLFNSKLLMSVFFHILLSSMPSKALVIPPFLKGGSIIVLFLSQTADVHLAGLALAAGANGRLQTSPHRCRQRQLCHDLGLTDSNCQLHPDFRDMKTWKIRSTKLVKNSTKTENYRLWVQAFQISHRCKHSR